MNWIDIDKELPPPNEEDPGNSHFVLITDGKEIGLGSYEYEYFGEDHDDPITIYSSPSWYDATSLLEDRQITHWMPLPPLPN